MSLDALNQLLGIVYTVAATIAAIAATIGAVVSIRNRIIQRRTLASAKEAAASSAKTHDSITTGVDAMTAAVRALDTVRDNYDDLMAAYVNQKALENKVQIIGEYLAAREGGKHTADRLAEPPTTEGASDDQ